MTTTSHHKPFSSPERFDGAAAWATLSPEQQAEVGAIALEYMIAAVGCVAYCDVDGLHLLARPFEAAEPLLLSQLHDAMRGAMADTVPALSAADEVAFAPIPSRLGPVCRVCTCSEYDPCPEGCGWAEPDLCTACAFSALPKGPAS